MSPTTPAIFLSEMFDKDDQRVDSPEMRAAKMKETGGLLERGSFKFVLEE